MQYHTIPGPVTESPIHSVVCLSVNRMNSPPVQKEQIQMNGENKKKRCWNVFLKPLPPIVCCLSPPMIFKSVPPMVYVGARKSFWYLFLVTKTSKSPLKCWQGILFIPWFTVCHLNMDAKKKWFSNVFLPWFTVCHPACLPSPPTPEQVGVGGEGGEKV